MHVVSRKKLMEAAARRNELEGPLDAWFRITKKPCGEAWQMYARRSRARMLLGNGQFST
jgi:hypothetical protein